MKRIGGLWRELRPDGNPLRRTCDRAEAAVLAGLLALLLVAVPLAAVIVGGRVYAGAVRAERAEQASWRQVPAVLLTAAPVSGSEVDQTLVRAVWTAPDGVQRAGEVTVPSGTPSGRTVRMWVDASGRPAGQPLTADDVISRAVTLAVAAAAGVGAALLGSAAAVRWMFFRRRVAAWDAEWRAAARGWGSLR